MRYFSLLIILSISGFGWMWFSSDHSHESPIFESSLSGVSSEVSSGGISYIDASVSFDSPRTGFYFSFPRAMALADTGITIIWHTEYGDIERSLDLDTLDMQVYESRIFSSPYITKARDSIHFTIISSRPLDISTITLMTSYSEESRTNLVSSVTASTQVISRSTWGADESYRYADSDMQKKSFQEYLTYRQSPKTQSDLDEIRQRAVRDDSLDQLFPDTEKTLTLKRYENGHRLVWPIEHVRQVNRIVIHHTAENIEAIETSDEVYLRDIYKYHAITRGWGDIGYNYIIGQRGLIYEGRAGGDYVVGGHTPYNNPGSVGIALIGNFENIHLNRDQRSGLESAIIMVAQKYGISLSSSVSAITGCRYPADCTHVEVHSVRGLSGHRDYNSTACPGTNVYNELIGLVSKLDQLRVPIFNPESSQIDPLPIDEVMNMTLKEGSPPPNQTLSILKNIPKKSPKSPIVKIRLSYSGMTLVLEGATVSPPIARIGQRKISFNQGYQANIRLVGNNQVAIVSGNRTYTGASFSLEGEVVRVASWVRIPAWDTNRRYNDNLFRGKIVVRNIDGALVLVNELPIEDYLKGLGEVSNTDLPEKIKTIIVSARSYAYYYMDKTHRKYETLLYDGLDDPDSFQKYLGYGYEMRSPNVATAVDFTSGMIVKYHGEAIKTWYFSSSDGRTLSYLEYCRNSGTKNCMDIPYLQSVEDTVGVGKVRLGHGVGISGIGATYLASQGWDYQKIIQYYLKGVEISKK